MPGETAPTALIALSDYEHAAAEAMAPGPHGYYAGGAGDELTLADNVAAWRRYALLPRMLVGVAERDPSVTLLGQPRPHPLIVAPTAFQRLAHSDGEIEMARGASAAGAVMCLSTLGTTSPQALADAVPDAPRWFQLYVFKDRGVSRELCATAAANGYEAIVVTVDLPVLGVRERDLRSGVAAATADLVASAQAAGAEGAMSPAEFAELVDPGLDWSDIEQFAGEIELPLLVKGILRPDDARRAAGLGVAGIVVSNHGGRQLDGVLSGADALGPIADEVGGEVDLIVDGGIRRGSDVVKALALGAGAVMIGRPALWGLTVGGAAGVRRVLEILLAELDNALALAGCPRAAELDASFVASAPWR